MTWRPDPHIIELARTTLAPKQFRAFELIHIHGMTLRGAATYDREHRTTFVDRYDAAIINLERVGIYIDASNRPYFKETA